MAVFFQDSLQKFLILSADEGLNAIYSGSVFLYNNNNNNNSFSRFLPLLLIYLFLSPCLHFLLLLLSLFSIILLLPLQFLFQHHNQQCNLVLFIVWNPDIDLLQYQATF
ncbi:unnamed protein product [Acanthosepion pharaonis]|uniref:Uncharacterized protein n=1 Tax=Acanthosepion pharaonis TaxID=158019 RepID=A0A812E4S9_ACAPH|nr:unnamed protein product [Sepia pharaonis]